MNVATFHQLRQPDFFRAFLTKVRDFMPSFPELLNADMLRCLDADARAFRSVLTVAERIWIQEQFERARKGVEVLRNSMTAGIPASTPWAFHFVSMPLDTPNAQVAHSIFMRLAQTAARLMEHPNYIQAVGADLGIDVPDTCRPAA